MSPKTRYAPEIFITPDPEQAKKIILTQEAGLTTDQRWEMETPWLRERMNFVGNGLLIDYGCGIGRLAKLYDNPVLGVDISPSMRAHAEQYVGRPNFMAVHPPMFDTLIRAGLRAQGAYAVWVLQHILNPREDIELLAAALFSGTNFYIVNRNHRAIPAQTGDLYGWVSDGVDIYGLLEPYFEKIDSQDIPTTLCKEGATIQRWRRTTTVIESFIRKPQ